jgi:hypothetical protein
MRRSLLVLDTDLLALDDKLGHEPIPYLVEQQEQGQSKMVALSLAGQAKLSSLELVPGAATSGSFAPAKFPLTPQPGHDLSAGAEHRMNLTVRQLQHHWDRNLTVRTTPSTGPESWTRAAAIRRFREPANQILPGDEY